MKVANGRSDIKRISFVREPEASCEVVGDTVPSKRDLEGVTTKLVLARPKRVKVQFLARSAVQPAMVEEIV